MGTYPKHHVPVVLLIHLDGCVEWSQEITWENLLHMGLLAYQVERKVRERRWVPLLLMYSVSAISITSYNFNHTTTSPDKCVILSLPKREPTAILKRELSQIKTYFLQLYIKSFLKIDFLHQYLNFSRLFHLEIKFG